MKVHLIRRQTVELYFASHAAGRASFETWYSILRVADWKDPLDIVQTFRTADILGRGSKRVVFNLAGNKFRVICSYHFGVNCVHLFVKWIGTHAEYNKLCREGRQFYANDY